MAAYRTALPDLPFLPQSEKAYSALYAAAMERLIEVVQALSRARDLNHVIRIVRDAARELTGADGATFVLRDGEQCYYVDENAIAPLWKGKRFPLSLCISGWAMLNRETAVIEDIYSDPRIPHEAYRPTFVKSLVMVPIRSEQPVGSIGNYWAHKHQPTAEEITILQALADSASVAMENVRLIADLAHNAEVLRGLQTQLDAQADVQTLLRDAVARDADFPDLVQPEGAAANTNDAVPMIATTLMFSGQAEEAMRFYVSLFPDSRIVSLDTYGLKEGGKPGSVRQARFTLNGSPFICLDSPIKHEFGFTPATSVTISCATEAEVDRLFTALSDDGQVLMPLAAYDFSPRFGWVNDRFGVSWQINLFR
ncbi:VOC family protein [Asticcacaulis sp. BYS171W]|uniref:VOC family protein n=1 Tax=Asticcacaulis aquaticus TaxID=2984212 RepID=A0ABT5HPI9_9CAUL|nr:VOC family protein [Asticcacaulis aquaticus]MDC7681985.1 VOC family protein [Asticcacaulis aquaticus]